MPITRTQQNWTIGQTVKVGFMTLRVIGFTPTPGDWMPDVYTLESAKGAQYRFTPHHGLERLNFREYIQSAPVPPPSIPFPVSSFGRMFRD